MESKLQDNTKKQAIEKQVEVSSDISMQVETHHMKKCLETRLKVNAATVFCTGDQRESHCKRKKSK